MYPDRVQEQKVNTLIRTRNGEMRPRQRTQFCEVQTRVLEETFKSCNYPSIEMKKLLAEQLKLPENRVTVWFQNRRAKQRRHHRKEELSRLIDESRLVESKPYPRLAPINNNWTSSPTNASEPIYPEQPTSTTQQPWSPIGKPIIQQPSHSFAEHLNFNFGNGFMLDPALNFAQSHPGHQIFDNNPMLWGECDVSKPPASGVVPSSANLAATYYTPPNYPQLWASSGTPNNVNLPIPACTAPNYAATSAYPQVNN
uniref:Homeobox domain-containing protein n=1 Tax=Panagrellus redivivus TaxID=6233 RepID=A0A7E4ULS1_PANRE